MTAPALHFPPGLIIAAPASGSGKTVFTLGLLRHLAQTGVAVASAKAGPDYIDPAFHARATGVECFAMDPWAMTPARLCAHAHTLAHTLDSGEGTQPGTIICEGVMGLFDGTVTGEGSTADLARITGWPVVLVMDAGNQGASVAAALRGFATHEPDVRIAGVVFNKVGTARHERIVREAAAQHVSAVKVLGAVPRISDLALPGRHLGLVQAAEHPDLDAFMDRAADLVAGHVDVAGLLALAGAGEVTAGAPPSVSPAIPPLMSPAIPPLGGHIAVARDAAFAFAYAHVLAGWRDAGAALSFFSPLLGEGPVMDADAVYLPGGYPELHAGRLATGGFLPALRLAAERGAAVFGECGGYMVLGRALTDADGQTHEMAGLLAVETSFLERRMHLGYRHATLATDCALGVAGAAFRAHEFHYATVVAETGTTPAFHARDAEGTDLGPVGLVQGRVAGSFLHLIAGEDG